MANTGNEQVNLVQLNDGTTAVSATGTGTAATTFTQCREALLLLNCVAVASAGIFTPKLSGSVDGGTTYSEIVATAGTPLANVSATGLQQYRYKNLPPKVRLDWTKVSGTSVTVAADLIGFPIDSANATSV